MGTRTFSATMTASPSTSRTRRTAYATGLLLLISNISRRAGRATAAATSPITWVTVPLAEHCLTRPRAHGSTGNSTLPWAANNSEQHKRSYIMVWGGGQLGMDSLKELDTFMAVRPTDDRDQLPPRPAHLEHLGQPTSPTHLHDHPCQLLRLQPRPPPASHHKTDPPPTVRAPTAPPPPLPTRHATTSPVTSVEATLFRETRGTTKQQTTSRSTKLTKPPQFTSYVPKKPPNTQKQMLSGMQRKQSKVWTPTSTTASWRSITTLPKRSNSYACAHAPLARYASPWSPGCVERKARPKSLTTTCRKQLRILPSCKNPSVMHSNSLKRSKQNINRRKTWRTRYVASWRLSTDLPPTPSPLQQPHAHP